MDLGSRPRQLTPPEGGWRVVVTRWARGPGGWTVSAFRAWDAAFRVTGRRGRGEGEEGSDEAGDEVGDDRSGEAVEADYPGGCGEGGTREQGKGLDHLGAGRGRREVVPGTMLHQVRVLIDGRAMG